jgi:hypothetical protein
MQFPYLRKLHNSNFLYFSHENGVNKPLLPCENMIFNVLGNYAISIYNSFIILYGGINENK